MGKKGNSEVEVTKFFMSLHYGVCIGPVTLTRIMVKEKEAWSGDEDAQTSFVIEQDQLFGGNKKEGGVEGVVYWLPGETTQVLDDELAVKLGRADGADAPGYRGLASIFFVGPVGTPFASYDWDDNKIKKSRGFYWAANNPYLSDIWIGVRRAPVGLDPDYAMVPTSPTALTGEVELTWWQNSQGVNDAPGRMGISFRDSSGTQIGDVTWSAWSDPTVWTERTVSATCPDDTATIRIHMHADRNSGTYADAFFDDISATLDGTPLDIINPGAEIGDMTGWTGSPYYVAPPLGPGHSGGGPTAHGGAYYFAGGIASNPQIYQDISLSPSGGDANPAHIIYECLTNTDWGMGSPTSAIDTASFESAGITLYGEAFGLSLLWTRQASIQDFIQEILDHINAVVFVDPSTGLLTLKLIRGDYDPDTLPVLDPDNADLASFSRKLWGEITNEIIVTWTNPETEQEETAPPAQDLASIAMQGLVSDSRNYYGVRNATLATRLAWRELRSAGTPLASCEAEVDRTQWQLRPGSVVKVDWPEYGLDEVVFRVMSVDYGKPGDPTIKLQLLEDVFGLDYGDYVAPPSSSWEDPSEDPEALTIERLFTMPLFMAANSGVSTSEAVYPEVLAGVLATTSQEDAYAYDLWDEMTLPNGDLEWQELTTNSIIGHATLAADIDAEAVSTGVTFASVIGDTTPSVGGFVIIGDGGEDENEIAMFDDVADPYELTRGVLDTVPRAWPAGTPVWFLDGETVFEYPRVLSAGETLDVKLLTRTSGGVLPLGSAALVSHDLTERPWLPNRPANVEVEGVQFNTAATPVDLTERTDPWVTISWANRNRLTEDSQVLAWTDATVTPETGQTTGIEVLAEDGVTVVDTITGLSGTSHDVPDASFGAESLVLIRPFAERSDDDGDFVSLQAHGIWVQVSHARITEDDEFRETEDGELRATED